MTREAYHRALKEIESDTLEMGEMVKKAIRESIDAMVKRDIEKSKEIIKNDVSINRKRFDIEERCILIIATQQPMAGDLRILAAILNIITDLERMGDHAEGNAKINLLIGDEPLVKPLIDIPKMAEAALKMLDNSLKAFVTRDIELAKTVCNEDDSVDVLYEQVYMELLLLMIKDPKKIKGATYLIWLAHNVERIADRATNIAERVVYMVLGKMEELNVSRY